MAAKGIRVNQLAKELGVESKSILAKCRDEGLGEKVPNHMSVLSVGLTETVREWFTAGHLGGGGTAVETAPPVEVATRLKRPRTRKPTDTDGHDDIDSPDADALKSADEPANTAPAIAEAPVSRDTAPVEMPVDRVEPAAPRVTEDPVAETPVAQPVAPAAAETSVATPPAPLAPAAHAPAHPAPSAPTAPTTPVSPGAPALAPAAPPSAGTAAAALRGTPSTTAPDPNRPQVSRPTITLSGRGTGPAVVERLTPERKPVVVAPQLTTLQPAKISGPNIVRVEKPDNVPAPKSRITRPGGGSDSPSFNQARPATGRGVRVSDEEEEAEAKKKLAGGSGSGGKGPGGRTLSNRRRGPDGRRGDALAKLKEFSEADLEERRTRLNAAGSARARVEDHLKRVGGRGTHILAKTGVQRGEPIEIEEPITVKGLSGVLGIKSNDIVRKLLLQGVSNLTINSSLDRDTAETIALEYGIELLIRQQATLEEDLVSEFEEREASTTENLVPRPPVVTILGHVDHGKTSLLDRIRKANVAAGEAGGITQHTAAWMVQIGEGDTARRVTFIDTPGHQAFTSMRARGANMTDVVVLVVSAAEGVQPQTIESINHAKAADVPIVVAMNKIDRPDVNEQQVLGQLAANGLNPVEWGGDTEVVRTSAVTGQGIQELIEILHYQAELLELKADPTAPSRGTVIESRVDAGLGTVATVLVQEGTLHVGDAVLCGPGYGRVRMLLNDLGESIAEAGPSTPVLVSGLNALPNAGDHFYVVEDVDRARMIAEERQLLQRQSALAGKNQVTLDNLFANLKAGDVKTINLIIKADVQGSVETLQKTVTDANTDEVKVRVIHAAVGGITESDVELADASHAVIIGFHVVPDEAARAMAEQRRVELRLYRVIYEIFDDLKKALSGLLEPEIREKLHGHAEVRAIFKVSRVGNIGGCMVTDGHIQRGSRIRLSRGGIVITQDLAIETLRRLKDDVKEVKSGLECGIKLAGYDDIKEGDILEAYIRETIQRTL